MSTYPRETGLWHVSRFMGVFILGLFTPTMAMFLDSSILIKFLGSAACFPGLAFVCRAWYSASDQCERVKGVAFGMHRMHRMRKIYASMVRHC